jgi:hypothetical protein
VDGGRPIRWHRIALAGLLAVGAIWWLIELAGNLYWAPANLANDLWTYRQAGTHVLLGHAIYPAAELARPFILPAAAWGQGFVYPPPAALASIPLALLPPVAGWVAFTAVTAVALVAAALGLMWLAPRWSGYLAVVGGLLKVVPGAGLVWTWRQRGPLAGPLVLGVVLSAAVVLLLGLQPWVDFVTVMHNARPSSPYYVQSVTRVFGPVAGYVTVAVLLGLVLMVRDDAIAFALLSIAMIAPAPDLVPHYMLIPMVGLLPLVSRTVARATAHAPAAASPGSLAVAARLLRFGRPIVTPAALRRFPWRRSPRT